MSSIYTPLLQKVKAHHQSVNAAYATYYGAGTTLTSTATTPSPSQQPSARPSMDSTRTRSTTSTSSTTSTVNKAWSTIKKAAREHHESVNAAYEVYYGQTIRTSSSAAPARSLSTASTVSGDNDDLKGKMQLQVKDLENKETKARKAWARVKKMAREHHDSVNTAYDAYWAAGMR